MNGNIRVLLGDRVREIRDSQDLTQRELAKLINVGNSTISNIENAKGNVTLKTIEKVADALHIDSKELLNFTQDKTEIPEVINRFKQKYPDVPGFYVKVFSYCFSQGLIFSDEEDYYFLWIVIEGLIKKRINK